ncbi:DeoR/GlpR family DNA-binding transcription regulator [Paenibacillus sp. FSL E2-8871]|uniref:DeoR family transcriptional regulator n=2 Tax=Paenibacillus TaxID=44249 RepID=A0A1R0ZPI9_9BACL|nr:MULTISPECIES: DeoR/GlpR family DNA-binding transcription regulator [Paenibacillus]HBS46079.1 DeoR/GlpR transcriptional regulator [Paenibacillus sp.]AIQ23338.1 DeoR faimly transcriptional regulator [Paenibacillus sp. FSL H7-0737]KAA1191008.1 DeoR/GlpR transcriptional regulator [Paenibacillus sp. B2(2019)]OME74488.1 DeoR family transcriptional regulator [Paenibacillus odorifer]CAH1056094.1 putative HTH-type transcriptional regulator YdjF [Paenibacillus pseudetheri]
MLIADRYERIVELVNERGSIRVSELSTLCQVTEETIRRDLDRLEKAGRLLRSHGGAVSLRDRQPETPYAEREIMNAAEKQQIAREAVMMIKPGDRILLDASTTAWYMASHLPDMPLTVLTNSIRVAAELSGKERIDVISTGGQLSRRSMSFVGHLAERSLELYHVDKMFFSCKGFHLERGASESNELQAMVKRKMISIAEQVILLCDSSKFGIQAFTHVATTSELDVVITDYSPATEQLKQLQELNIAITTV